MKAQIEPKRLTGKIVEVTDMSGKIELKGKMGILNLPLRSIFTDKPLEEDQEVEIWISYANVID
ncbi:hypothetical protein SAMN05192551_103206 [Tindallia magadiensis]|uniref:Uncharacterized protein n=1 Tax=Tindallia magadiensis TaxID=69895 RepID=A0A1I3D9V0_9FIRM|nr:CBO2463/CBO2479 domain-containing protein [Tindallia magadiensis]SFH83328.1 hypothetical protein SAMN05192551_103206 [Tindallia magadiensis]